MKGKIGLLKPLIATFTVLLYVNVASADPWVSSPSVVLEGDDLEIQGGGAPGNSELLIGLYDRKTGKKISETVVFTRSNGDFSTSFPLVNKNVEVRMVVNGQSLTSHSAMAKN